MASTIVLHAKEIYRLACNSILEIENQQKRALRVLAEQHVDDRCTHWFGLWSHRKFQDIAEAMESPILKSYAGAFNKQALQTSILLRDASNYLLNNENILEEQKTINLTITDFQAIS